MLRVHTVGADEREAFRERIAELDRGATYPFGADRFAIDHGADWFAFFDRLGEARVDVVLDGDRVIAVACAVLRELPFRAGAPPRDTWYLCGLKVHPDYRGQHIPFRIATHGFTSGYRRCSRGYAITMNPGDGSENRVVRLVNRIGFAPFELAERLDIYSLDADSMNRLAPAVVEARGPISYLSIAHAKDIVLQSTGMSLPLHHVQHGPWAADGASQPIDGAMHMLCAFPSDPLAGVLRGAGIMPSADASVLSHRMDTDFRFLLTSDI